METFAKLFALATAEEQAAWLNTAGRMLKRACDQEFYAELQISRLADRLDTDGKWFLEKLSKFAE